jgi:GNAT superfamily N-acetyltransferase
VDEVRRWSGPEILAQLDELKQIYEEAYAEPPYRRTPEHVQRLGTRLAEQVDLPGFVFVGSTMDSAVAGFTFGRHFEALQWWYGAQDMPPAELLAAEKFAVSELVVAPAYRGQRLASRLIAELLRDRHEPYAILLSHPDAVARRIYARWGWRQVGTASATARGTQLHALALDLPQWTD